MAKPIITQDELKQQLHYDPLTGIFTWLNCPRKPMNGKVAGAASHGYLAIRVNGQIYGAHRLAWLYIKGEFPKNYIDHINMVRSDNRIANLRDATQSENMRNCNLMVSNKSGHKGISWHVRDKRWRAWASLNKKYVHLGNFINIEDAIIARENFVLQNYGEFSRQT